MGFPDGSERKESALGSIRRRPGFDPWIRKIHWRKEWQPTPAVSPGESHGQRSLVGYSPCGHKEWATNITLYHTNWKFYIFLAWLKLHLHFIMLSDNATCTNLICWNLLEWQTSDIHEWYILAPSFIDLWNICVVFQCDYGFVHLVL